MSQPLLYPLHPLADRISLADIARAHDVRFLLATFVDMTGKPCAKLVPVEAADELEAGAMGFAGYAAGLIGQKPQDADLIAVPDLASFTPVPFIKEGLAIIHCDPHVNGKPWPYAPRVILKNTLARLADQGMQAKIGAEVEYFLVNKNDDGTLSTADARDDSPRPCYDARGVTRMYDHLTSISEAMNGLGWGNYANDHEDAAGQFEQNFNYADALTTADRVVTLRYILNILAEQRGMTATFMPKPFTDRTGTGLHFHLSLWSGAEALFPGTTGRRGRRRPRPWAVRARLLLHRRHPGARAGAAGVPGPDGEFVQALGRHHQFLRRHLVAAEGLLRRQRPHAHDPRPGQQADRTPLRRRLGQPLPRHRHGHRGRAGRRGKGRRSRARRPARASPSPTPTCCRPRCCTPWKPCAGTR